MVSLNISPLALYIDDTQPMFKKVNAIENTVNYSAARKKKEVLMGPIKQCN